MTSLLLGSGMASLAASPGVELNGIVADCQDDKAGCEEALWRFIDVSGDDRLTVAEISRFFRFAVGDQDHPPAQMSADDGLLASVIGGPLGARVFISNFDFDGDGRVSRKEFYRDAGSAGMQPLLKRLRQAFAEIASQATTLAGALAGGTKKAADAQPPAAVQSPAPGPATRVPSDPHAATFRHLAGQCWEVISSAGEAQAPVFTYRVNLKTNGFLAGEPKRRSKHSRTEATARLYEITKRRGLDALANCQPYELPLEDYQRWKEFDVSFDPQGLRQVRPAQAKSAPAKTAKKRKGVPLRKRVKKPSAKIIQAFDRQFARCWNTDPKPKGKVAALMVFRLQLSEDGGLERTKMLASRNKVRGWKGVRDAAIKAFAKCQPYDLPVDKYRQWQVIEVELWPTGFRSF